MKPKYQLQIITLQGIIYKGEIIHALLPVQNGFVGILANHAPFITYSRRGELKIQEGDNTTKAFLIGSGFFEVNHNKASLITTARLP